EAFADWIGAKEIMTFGTPPRSTVTRVRNALLHRTLPKGTFRRKRLISTLRRNGVDVVFASHLSADRTTGFPTLALIPDFQHRYFPELFLEEELKERDRVSQSTAESANLIVVFSDAVKTDFSHFYPAHAPKARTLRPVTFVDPGIYAVDPGDIRLRYNLPEKFFYLPNQFWMHKNHTAVLEALGVLKSRGIEAHVVATGYSIDYRNHDYFGDIWSRVARLGVGRMFTYLGLMPAEDVHALIRQSICVVNPSLFEGWGLSVDEARSIGKRLLVSDLPAHREQDPPNTMYVNPRNVQAIADAMESLWNEAQPGADHEMEAAAREALPGRMKRFADEFVSIANEGIRGQGSGTEVRGDEGDG
ncbi:MAG: glycosyltransferase, partial [Acidobacteriota bacterium]